MRHCVRAHRRVKLSLASGDVVSHSFTVIVCYTFIWKSILKMDSRLLSSVFEVKLLGLIYITYSF